MEQALSFWGLRSCSCSWTLCWDPACSQRSQFLQWAGSCCRWWAYTCWTIAGRQNGERVTIKGEMLLFMLFSGDTGKRAREMRQRVSFYEKVLEILLDFLWKWWHTHCSMRSQNLSSKCSMRTTNLGKFPSFWSSEPWAWDAGPKSRGQSPKCSALKPAIAHQVGLAGSVT